MSKTHVHIQARVCIDIPVYTDWVHIYIQKNHTVIIIVSLLGTSYRDMYSNTTTTGTYC